ncbi:putative Protein-tyrosine-phosphatase [Vibrio chagasii]|nr:putative Protein-tyrosine-phosphatase [Vibrio chagasii]
MMTHSLLILGSNDRAALSFVRSVDINLVKNIHILRSTKNKQAACYSNKVNSSDYISLDCVEKAIVDLKSYILHSKIKYLVCIDDNFSELVYQYYDDISSLVTILGPSLDSYLFAKDKLRIRELCDSKVLLYPDTLVIDNLGDEKEVINYDYFKTRFSAKVIGSKIFRYSVKHLLCDRKKSNYIRDHISNNNILCQKKIDGEIIGLNVLAFEGEVYSVSVNERIHQPKGGGGSSYRKSMPVDDQLVNIAKHVSTQLNWSGVMMIELLKSKDKLYIVEINPRFWGSLSLTIFSGHDVVNNLLRLYIGLPLIKDNFRSVHTRHLFKDIVWLVKNFSVNNVIDFVNSPINVMKNLEKYDVESFTDPLPSICQIYIKLSEKLNSREYVFAKLLGRIPIKREVINSYDINHQYVFLCKGNVNRSAFAHFYLKSKGYSNVDSAGYLDLPDRKFSHEMFQLAKFNCLNVDDHASKHLSAIKDKSIKVVAMDAVSYEISKSFGFVNTFMFSSTGIKDPHGESMADFSIVVEEIINEISKKI